jgi:hypothetical protein
VPGQKERENGEYDGGRKERQKKVGMEGKGDDEIE